MAGTSSTQVNPSSIISDLGNLATIFKGKSTTTSGGTETTTKSLSLNSANALVKSMLEGSSGLASIAGAEKSAGLYSSSVNQMLTNDLMARTAAAVAEKESTTTTTKTPTTVRTAAQIDPMSALLSAGGSIIGKKVLDKSGINKVIDTQIDKISSSISNALGLSGGSESLIAASGEATAGVSEISAVAAPAAIETFGLDAAAGLGSEAAVGAGVDALAEGSAMVEGASLAEGAAVAEGAGALVEGAGLVEGASAIGEAAAAAEGAAVLEEAAVAVAAWVICTELKSSGELDEKLYKVGASHISAMPKHVVNGYHYWAIPYTRLMRKNSIAGKIARKFITPWAIGRTKYLAGNWNILGWLTVVIGEPACGLIGKFVGTQDWNSLYTVEA